MNRARDLSVGLVNTGLMLLVVGMLVESEVVLAWATIAVGFGYFARDYFTKRDDSINVMSVYALFAALFFGTGNLVGFLSEGGVYEPIFNKYNVREFHYQAQVLAAFGTVIPVFAYDLFKHFYAGRADRAPILPVGFEVGDRKLLAFSLTMLGLAWVVRLGQVDLSSLGTLGALVSMGSLIAIFALNSRLSVEDHELPRWCYWIPAAAMITEATYSAMFNNLRVTVLWPIVAFCLPFILRKRVTPRRWLAFMCLLAIFVLAFKPLGELRGKIFGTERLVRLAQQTPLGEDDDVDEEYDPWGIMAFAARLSTYNQLSQVVRIVEDEGHYNGETLAYITYVFIPRAIWPEKPLITPGQWFASKLGKGQQLSDVKFSNAINMTIPGELYLNFGWAGLILGLGFLGLLYYLFWFAAGFHRGTRNPLGKGFACILLMQAAFNGSDVAAIVNMVLWYILFMAVTWSLAFMANKRHAAPKPEPLGPLFVPVQPRFPVPGPREPATKLVGPYREP